MSETPSSSPSPLLVDEDSFPSIDAAQWRDAAGAAIHPIPLPSAHDEIALPPLARREDVPWIDDVADPIADDGEPRIAYSVFDDETLSDSASLRLEPDEGVRLRSAEAIERLPSDAPICLDATLAEALEAAATRREGLLAVRDPIAALWRGETLDAARQFADASIDVAGFSVDARPLHEAGGSSVLELAAALAGLRDRLADALDADALERCAPNAHLSTDADFFVSLAKLRAARLLWLSLLERCGVDAETSPPLRVIAHPSRRMLGERVGMLNVMRVSHAAMAAFIGGANGIVALPHDAFDAAREGSKFGRRLARASLALLRDEAHLTRFADAARGSFYIERLTDALCERAWSRFAETFPTRRLGVADMEASARSGAALCAEERRRRRARVAEGRAPLTGISLFPRLDDVPLAAAVPPREGNDVVLPEYRDAEDFDALRRAADSDSVPLRAAVIPLGGRGGRELVSRAESLLAAGGIAAALAESSDVEAATRFAATLGSPVAVLAGGDDVAEIASTLRDNGVRAVWQVVADHAEDSDASATKGGAKGNAKESAKGGAKGGAKGIDRVVREGDSLIDALRELRGVFVDAARTS